MNDSGGSVSAAFPRPGRALKAVLIAIAVAAVAGAVVVNWAPGGATGVKLFQLLAFDPAHPLRAWSWLTSGILTNPQGFSHALWSLVGLYFLTTDLEKRWGGARLLRFLATSVVLGNLLVFLLALLPLKSEMFHPALAFGPMAAITATALAWAKENANRQIRLFFFLPISGKALFWVTIGFVVLAPLFGQGGPEGVAGPVGGILAGVLLGGSPSVLRSLWLRMRLSSMRRGGAALTAESLGPGSDRTRSPKRKGGPPLSVVRGGLDDDKKPPKDKRYLN
jgi:membrane associated rhomboid family serine protease